MRHPLWAVLVLPLVLALPASAFGAHLSPEGERGEAIFLDKCASCHTIGGGRSAGPDLAGVTQRREREWLLRIITDPGALLDGGDPLATRLLEEFRGLRMPDMGVSRRDAEALLEYLSAAESAAPSPSLPAGDPEIGGSLFTGAVRLENGGAPCAACHAVAGLPGGGATLGPDLTATYVKYGEEGTALVLEELPFPSMSPIYATRPLTAPEQAHLAAFLREVSDREPSGAPGRLLLLGLGGGALAAGVARTVWRNRLREVRRPLLRKASGQAGGDR